LQKTGVLDLYWCKKFGLACLVALLIFLLVFALDRMTALSLYGEIDRNIESWQKHSPTDLHDTNDSFYAALVDLKVRLNEMNQRHYSDIDGAIWMFTLNMWALAKLDMDDDEKKRLIEETRKLHQEIVSSRPISSYHWSNYALFKAQLGEFDMKFSQALALASELGTWEKEVQMLIVRVGLSSWDFLDPKDRKRVLDVLSKSLLHYAEEVKAVALSYRKLDIYCLILKGVETQSKLFKQECH
jgi:hypothetical protein